MPKIKICGLREKEDVEIAIRLGIDALGFIFYEGSKRFIEPDKARQIIKDIPPFISVAGVFVDAKIKEIKKIREYCGIDIVQLHGSEPFSYCLEFPRVIKAFRIEGDKDIEKIEGYKGITWLLDKKEKPYELSIAKQLAKKGRVILSGGLNPENIKEAIRIVSPYGVDVSSGIEEYPGKKDHKKMEEFVRNAKLKNQNAKLR
ncbi:MAG: phosphoribosylanthranilate isomerase [bacterium]